MVWPQAVLSSLGEDLGTTVFGPAGFLRHRCILAGMQVSPWRLLKAGAPQLVSDGDPVGSVFPLPAWPPALQMHPPAVSCCPKGPAFRFNVISHRLGNGYRCCVCNSTISQVPEEPLPLSAFS